MLEILFDLIYILQIKLSVDNSRRCFKREKHYEYACSMFINIIQPLWYTLKCACTENEKQKIKIILITPFLFSPQIQPKKKSDKKTSFSQTWKA